MSKRSETGPVGNYEQLSMGADGPRRRDVACHYTQNCSQLY